MRPKIAETVPEAAWKVLDAIQGIMTALPEQIELPTFICGIRVSSDMAVSHGIPNCHVITHALAEFLPVEVHDGFVSVMRSSGEMRNLEHSWLTIRGGDTSIIIDPWPLGVATGPAIFVQDYAYHFGPEYCFLKHRTEEFISYVEALTAAIQSLLTPSERETLRVVT